MTEAPSTPTHVGERYEIVETLGHGGMGIVVAARDLESPGDQVAIKLIRPDKAEDDKTLRRFVREARTVGALGNPHIVAVLDVGEEDGAPFIVMERLEGVNLADLVRRRGRLSPRAATGYLLEALEGVAHAHANDVVHRDLKPSNLFLAEVGDARIVKVLDFGVSKARRDAEESTELTGTDALVGSPRYMSPEQIRDSRDVDARSDIWSLGVILHHLLTESSPFEATSAAAQLAMIVSDPPTPLRAQRPDAPPELEDVILGCLQKRPERRYQDVAQLAEAVAPLCDGGERAARIREVLSAAGKTATARPRRSARDLDVTADSTDVTVSAPVMRSPTASTPKWPLWVGGSLALAAVAFAWWGTAGPSATRANVTSTAAPATVIAAPMQTTAKASDATLPSTSVALDATVPRAVRPRAPLPPAPSAVAPPAKPPSPPTPAFEPKGPVVETL